MEHDDAVYVTFNQVQDRIDFMFSQTGEKPSYQKAILSLYEDGQYKNFATNRALVAELMDKDSNEFLARKGELYLKTGISRISEGPRLPKLGENITACLLRRFANEATPVISHTNFEITYIYNGSYTFVFEDEERTVNEGDVLIVSPRAKHCFSELSYDSFFVQVHVNYKTFHSTFLSLLNDDNVLSNFFKTILTNQQQTNYLLLSTGASPPIHSIARKMFLEQYMFDLYSPQCTYNWLQLFFSYVLRSYSEMHQFSVNAMGVDFAPVLRYLEKNYLTTSLNRLAEEFHYSSSYMSVLIKQITGKTYSELIRELKINDAKNYLLHSNMTIEKIAAMSGYNSADHFSRTFKSVTGISPQQYRTNSKKQVF